MNTEIKRVQIFDTTTQKFIGKEYYKSIGAAKGALTRFKNCKFYFTIGTYSLHNLEQWEDGAI